MAPRRGGDRRGLLRAAAVLGGAGLVGGVGLAWLRDAESRQFAAALAETRGPPSPLEAPGRALVHYAVMAANSHNTQPWRFDVAPDLITIRPDLARRTPVVDPDNHHLYASLGCALENMVQAASALGLRVTPEVTAEGLALARLEAAPVAPGALFQAIPRRQSTRVPYDGGGLSRAELRALHDAAADESVEVLLTTGTARMETLLDLIVAGNAAQMRDDAFVAELLAWLRFSHGAAAATRDGLFAGAAGRPVVPEAFGRQVFPHVFTLASETEGLVRQVRSSAGLAIFVSERDEPAAWVQAGRAAQRFCLQATALGLKTAWLNQPVEVPGLREALAAWLGVAPRRPDFILRFGRGPDLPQSLRRPATDVIA
jgi:hypothetical protein